MTGDGRKRVLFVCVHNSARSQMAEAWLNLLAGDRYEAESAGLEPGRLNPVVVAAMRESGIDISMNETTPVTRLIEEGRRFDYVITVCDEAAAERCPVFPGGGARVHWSFPDPSGFQGSKEKRLAKTREVRDAIKEKIAAWLDENENRAKEK